MKNKVKLSNTEIEGLSKVYGIDVEHEITKILDEELEEAVLNQLGLQSPRQIEAEKKILIKIRKDRDNKIDNLLN